MQADGDGNVVQMEAHEVTLSKRTTSRLAAAAGRDRDDLPYTDEFDQLRDHFNQQAGRNDSPRQFWLLLKHVLKYGVRNIARFLESRG